MGFVASNITKTIIDETLFENLNIIFPEKGFVFIKGKSGCGKTALLHILAGHDANYSGEVLFNKQNILARKDYKTSGMTYMNQPHQLFEYLTVYQNCIQILKIKELEIKTHQIDTLLKEFDLYESKDMPVYKLSGGMKQRVAFIQAIICQTPIMFFDEPTSALNEEYRIKIYKKLKDLSKKHLIIVVSHDETVESYSQYIIDFNNLQHQYIFNTQPYIRYTLIKNSIKSNNIKECIKLLIHEKRKVILAFISQIYMFFAMTFIISGIYSYYQYYENEYQTTINCNLVMIEKRNQHNFSKSESKELKAKHPYMLEYGKVEKIDYIQSFPLQKKLKKGHVYINKEFYKHIQKKTFKYTYNQTSQNLKVDKIIDDKRNVPTIYYHDQSIDKKISKQLVNYNVCYKYVDDVKEYIDKLDYQYVANCQSYNEYLGYIQIIDLFKNIAVVFIVVALIVMIVVLSYILISLIYNQISIYTTILSNTQSIKQAMTRYSTIVFFMTTFLFIVSSLISTLIIFFINYFKLFKILFDIDLIIQLPILFMNHLDLYIIYFIAYQCIGVILLFVIYCTVKKQNLTYLLRGDLQC